MTEKDIWGYHEGSGHHSGIDLVGYKVEATDGHIGKVDKHSADFQASHIVVDTGVWIFGKHVLLPAGTVERIDPAEEKVYLNLTKEQIRNAPDYDEAKYAGEPNFMDRFGHYYGQSHM
ncbi:PRC-barrel domain-containing protein [Streptomyces yangpuensis]|uniref:PRC-barrel domain-containing protein n=1 Tax=Streptomyces yangpuensis TaxID=1648182 RepID=UPI003642F33A